MTKRSWVYSAIWMGVGILFTPAFGCEVSGTDSTDDAAGAPNVAGSMAVAGALSVAGSAASGSPGAGGSSSGLPSAGSAGASFGGAAGGPLGGAAGSGACGAGHIACSGTCADTANDDSNCGSCGTSCGTGQSCQAGQCQCVGGRTLCGSICAEVSSDAMNCGACGRACPSGQLCSQGQCTTSCATGLAVCGQACVDTSSSLEHCGGCSTPCSSGLTCNSGRCECSGGLTRCGESCVNTSTSASNCGACGTACQNNQTCSGGSCQCASGQTACSEGCVNTQTDAMNCGSCGTRCAAGGTCSGGTCSGIGGACNFALPSYNGNGSLTYYTLAMGSLEVNCSFPILGRNPDRIAYVHTGEGRYFAAMNTADYDNAAVCGACVEVSRDDGRKVTVTVVDQCPIGSNPKCTRGHIDLSQAAFTQVGTITEGYLGTGNGGAVGRISWKYVPCPVTGNVTYRLKEPSNQNWNEILVGNTRTPIDKFEAMVGGSWRTGVRQPYNYWSVQSGNLGAGPWRVRATDIRGNAVDHAISSGTAEHVSTSQLTACE